ncbi:MULTISPECIES: hypothetical protein [unclassified Legionella]|uniref:hypothetical protein n=1 Tax=unclassified Legionella TaxID=2622702 RepID=UPI0010543A7C|nr:MULTISPECIES: hypothetical protein [unclassified Legionella]MDI9818576.1 hypothetical protein [Legionella sp. PL877]
MPVIEVGIIGAGPAGLAATASLFEEAKNTSSIELRIHLIEKRTEFTRRQKLIIPREKDLPAKELRWDTYCKQLFDPLNQLQINDAGDLIDAQNKPLSNLNKRQKFLRKLMRQKDEFNEPKNFSIRTLQEALKEHIDNQETSNVKFHWYPGTTVDSIDLKNRMLHLDKDNTTITFDYLLVCEGERRHLTQHINDAIKTEFSPQIKPFSFKKMGTPTYHMAARLTLKDLEKEKDYQEFLAKNRRKIEFQVKNLSPLGWDPREGKPDNAIFDDNLYKENRYAGPKWKPRLFIATPVPESLHETQNPSIKRKKVLEWASFFASFRMQVPPENFVIDGKGENETQSNVGTFLSDIHYADNPVRKLPDNSYIILLGDCAMSPYYPVGISSAFAMSEARIAASCIIQFHQQEEQFEHLITQYHRYQQIIADYTGYRNEEIEMIVRHIENLQETLQEEAKTLPVSNREELQFAMKQQNVINLLNKLCYKLNRSSNHSNATSVLKGCLEQLLITEETYFDAIEIQPVRELFDNMQNGQLLKELIQQQNSTTIKP